MSVEIEGRARVLVVEDNPTNRKIYARLLRDEYEVTMCETGSEASALVDQIDPHLVVLDIMMPMAPGEGIDPTAGLTVCRDLRRRSDREARAIMLASAKGTLDERIEGLEAGADDYVVKPFDHKEFCMKVRALIQPKRELGQMRERTEILEQMISRQEALAELGALTGGIAHDFANILQSLTYAQRMIGLAETLDEARTYGDEMREALAAAQYQLANIQIFASSQRLDERPLYLRDHVQNVVEVIKSRLHRQGVTVQQHYEPNLPPLLLNPGHLTQVLLNLLVNATDAMPKGGLIKLRAGSAPDGGLELQVTDTGEGIPESVLPRIFEFLFTTKRDKGTGFGLYNVSKIVQSKGGSVSVNSTPGVGTSFLIHLPPDVVLRDGLMPDDGFSSFSGQPVAL